MSYNNSTAGLPLYLARDHQKRSRPNLDNVRNDCGGVPASGVASFGAFEREVKAAVASNVQYAPASKVAAKMEHVDLIRTGHSTSLITLVPPGISSKRSSKKATQHASRQVHCFTFGFTIIGSRPCLHQLSPIVVSGGVDSGRIM